MPFRLLVTPRPARNVFFKTRFSSNAGYYNNKGTHSAVLEDASAATLDDRRGQREIKAAGTEMITGALTF